MTSVWIEKQRQKILKELGAGADGKEVGDDEVLKELKKVVDAELRLNYLVTGSQVPPYMIPKNCAN
jgi:phosphoserine aminotransferase